MAKKGYWVAQVDVTDPDQYKQYVAANGPVFRRYGARFLTRGGASETVEGKLRSRVVVLEFRDYATALECYRSAEYQAAKALRANAGTGDVAIIEGYDGPQPTD